METHQLLFELSHPSRYDIMKILAKEPTRLTRIGERVGSNNPEVSRHLDRMRSAGLVTKLPDGRYALSQSGRVVLSHLAGLDFIAEHLAFFHELDLSALPQRFMYRLGELGTCTREDGALANIHIMADIIRKAEKRIQVVFNEMSPELDSLFHERMDQGVDWRLVVERKLDFPISHGMPTRTASLDRIRVTEQIPLMALMSEGMACIMFPDTSGKIDYSVAFTSADLSFMTWCEDLFCHLWDEGGILQNGAVGSSGKDDHYPRLPGATRAGPGSRRVTRR